MLERRDFIKAKAALLIVLVWGELLAFAEEKSAVARTIEFADGSLGQRLRAFVRFGHTGEYGDWPGQVIAAIASLGACVLVYTGLSLAVRRFAAVLKRKRKPALVSSKTYEEQPVA
jgi:uncharacterized iron-regulated membrane protein